MSRGFENPGRAIAQQVVMEMTPARQGFVLGYLIGRAPLRTIRAALRAAIEEIPAEREA